MHGAVSIIAKLTAAYSLLMAVPVYIPFTFSVGYITSRDIHNNIRRLRIMGDYVKQFCLNGDQSKTTKDACG